MTNATNEELLTIIDNHSQQLEEIAKILLTLTKECKENRSLINQCSEVTDTLVKTLNTNAQIIKIMNNGILQ